MQQLLKKALVSNWVLHSRNPPQISLIVISHFPPMGLAAKKSTISISLSFMDVLIVALGHARKKCDAACKSSNRATFCPRHTVKVSDVE